MIRAESCRLFDVFFFFKQKTAYEMRISDWSSDVCSSDLAASGTVPAKGAVPEPMPDGRSATLVRGLGGVDQVGADVALELGPHRGLRRALVGHPPDAALHVVGDVERSEEHTSEFQSLMRISYAVFCLKNKKHI